MICSRERVIHGKAAYVLAATTVCFVAASQLALAAQVQGYMLFDVPASSNASAVAEKLRSTSLSNCLQLVVGGPEVVNAMIAASPMKRLGTVDEVAEFVLWLCSDVCSFTTGAVFDISGGRATY